MTADVTVYGAGIFGLSAAYACACRGARVQVIDPHGVAAGASGGPVGALAPHMPAPWTPIKAFQLDALLMAAGFWRGVAETGGGEPGYARNGRLQPLADDRAVTRAQAQEAAARDHWEGRGTWTVIAAPGGDPWVPLSPTGLLAADDLSARLQPGRACAALAAAITALGGRLERVGRAEGAIIRATGWSDLANRRDGTGDPIGGPVKGQAALLKADHAGQPQILADGLYIEPHVDGHVALGSTSEREFDRADSTDSALDALIDRVRAICPALAEAPVVARWAGLRPRARSRLPVFGPDPMRPGEFIANGGFKIGFAVAPLVAARLADLVIDGRDRIPPEFRLESLL